jgi:hypothetical protein
MKSLNTHSQFKTGFKEVGHIKPRPKSVTAIETKDTIAAKYDIIEMTGVF